jgi:hypothetical protein
MRTLILTAGAGLAALALSSTGASAQAPALLTSNVSPAPAQLLFGPAVAGSAVLEQAQYLFGGRNYCFYDSGWHGPGFYWCGYAFRRGYGWGGPEGFHGWSRGGGGFHGGGNRGGGRQNVHVNNSVHQNIHVGGGAHGGGHGGGGHAGGGHAGGGHAGGHGGGGHGGGGGHHH